MRTKNLIITWLFSIFIIDFLNCQSIHVNKLFEDSYGIPTINPQLSPFGIGWSKSITNNSGEIITVGHTTSNNQGENILLTKYSPDGTTLFQTNYNTTSTNNDYGISVTLDAFGNIFVCGVSDLGSSIFPTLLVLKYSSNGTLINSIASTDSINLNNIPNDIIVSSSGDIYISSTKESTVGNYNYSLQRFDASMNLVNTGNYDYNGLMEICLGLEINGTDIYVTGASQNSGLDWDYATAKFDLSCNYIADSRNTLSGVGFDQPLSITKDVNSNIYITGRSTSTLGTSDILTVKINNAFNVVWSATFDGNSMDDVGSSIAIDSNGDVIVGGHITTTNSLTEMVCLKYNGNNGTLSWSTVAKSTQTNGNVFIKKITINNANNQIYYLAGDDGIGGFKQVHVGRINSQGKFVWQKSIKKSLSNVFPSDLLWDNNEIYSVSILDSITNSYQISAFKEFEEDTSNFYLNGGALCKKNQLIIRFLPNSLLQSSIDNETGTTEFGDLKSILQPTAYATFTNAIYDYCLDCEYVGVKIFPDFKTTFTTTINYLGETIPVDEFWTAFLVCFNGNFSLPQLNNKLNHENTIIAYTHPNFIGMPHSPPNQFTDTLYAKQFSLHQNSIYPQAHVNATGAWNHPLYPSTGFDGKLFVRCGVLDCGVNWKHEEFTNPYNPSISFITNGWDFTSNINLKNITHGGDSVVILGNDYSSHGTKVMGIIGAARKNNTIGIAGIAGYNFLTGATGINLHALKVVNNNGATVSNFSKASLTSVFSPTDFVSPPPYAYGLHLENTSLGFRIPPNMPAGLFDSTIFLYNDVIHQINRMKVTMVASRGNIADSSINLPATIDDDWVINVAGSGLDGNYIHDNSFSPPHNPNPNGEFCSSFGRRVDIAAPSSSLLVISTGAFQNDTMYRRFNGTSAAAPHVTGAVGLLMSTWNQPNADPNNLAPEDCENIIQLGATDVDQGGNDVYSGSGRLNIGAAFDLLQKPFYNLYHVAADNRYNHTRAISLVSLSDTIHLTEPYKNPNNPNQWFQKGKYIVDGYRVSANITHNFPNQDSVIPPLYWPRPSSSSTWDSVFNHTLLPRERSVIDQYNISQLNGKIYGFIYKVHDSLGTLIGWWPFDTATARNKSVNLLEYSVLTRNLNFDVGVYNRPTTQGDVLIYPNPTENLQCISFSNFKYTPLQIDIYDVTGRKLSRILKGNLDPDNPTYTFDHSHLPNGIYFYLIKIGNETTCRKFIKE